MITEEELAELLKQQARKKREGWIKVGMTIFTAIVFFAYGTWKLVMEKMYFHVQVDQMYQDNESLTDAYRKSSALNRQMQVSVSVQQLKIEEQEEKLKAKEDEVSKFKDEKQEMLTEFQLLEKKFEKTQHEKDSLIAVLRSLRRAD